MKYILDRVKQFSRVSIIKCLFILRYRVYRPYRAFRKASSTSSPFLVPLFIPGPVLLGFVLRKNHLVVASFFNAHEKRSLFDIYVSNSANYSTLIACSSEQRERSDKNLPSWDSSRMIECYQFSHTLSQRPRDTFYDHSLILVSSTSDLFFFVLAHNVIVLLHKI